MRRVAAETSHASETGRGGSPPAGPRAAAPVAPSLRRARRASPARRPARSAAPPAERAGRGGRARWRRRAWWSPGRGSDPSNRESGGALPIRRRSRARPAAGEVPQEEGSARPRRLPPGPGRVEPVEGVGHHHEVEGGAGDGVRHGGPAALARRLCGRAGEVCGRGAGVQSAGRRRCRRTPTSPGVTPASAAARRGGDRNGRPAAVASHVTGSRRLRRAASALGRWNEGRKRPRSPAWYAQRRAPRAGWPDR